MQKYVIYPLWNINIDTLWGRYFSSGAKNYLPDFLVKKTLHEQLTFDKKYVCFKITNSARYEWGSRYGKRKERETDT